MTKARDIASAIPAPSTVSSAELGYLDGVTSAIQTQLDAKTAKSTLSTTGDIYYASGANTPARLGIGSTGNVLTVAGGVPTWAAPATPSSGFNLISTTSFSAVSSISLANGTFSSTYDNYRVLVSGCELASGDASLLIRYRASGSDNTTSNYYNQRIIGDGGTASASRNAGTDLIAVGSCGAGGTSGLVIDFFNPFASKKSEIYSFNNGFLTGAGNSMRFVTSMFNATTSFDSFTLFLDASTFSGICSVYGYAK